MEGNWLWKLGTWKYHLTYDVLKLASTFSIVFLLQGYCGRGRCLTCWVSVWVASTQTRLKPMSF